MKDASNPVFAAVTNKVSIAVSCALSALVAILAVTTVVLAVRAYRRHKRVFDTTAKNIGSDPGLPERFYVDPDQCSTSSSMDPTMMY